MRRRVGALGKVVIVVGLSAGVVAAATGVPAARSAGAAPAWSITPSASPFDPQHTPLSGVSCASPTSCFAVGLSRRTFADSEPGVVVERWDGSSWSVVAAPGPSGASLNAVSSASETSCFAVGGSTTTTLIEQWDGTSWSVVASPDPVDAAYVQLTGVSCATPTSCFAVGYYETASDTVGTVIEQWNGTSWALGTGPSGAALLAVSCPDVADCFAVGASAGGTAVEQWNGTTWSIVSSPNPPASVGDPLLGAGVNLDAVSCTSATSCMAVGYTETGPLSEQWDGTRWSIVASPDPLGASHDEMIELSGVSCSSAASCNAVGDSFEISIANEVSDVPTVSVAEHWNGTAWSIVAPPKRAPISLRGDAPLSRLNGISCPSATTCAAVGNSSLAEQWNGTAWSIAPLDAPTSFSHLDHVSCRSATSCFAVGSAYSLGGADTLVERWDGASWSVVPTPNPTGSDVDAELNAVSCASPTSCFAVGVYSKRTAWSEQAGGQLIEHWNGTTWTMVAGAAPAPGGGVALNGVSCPSTTSCTAVGSYDRFVGDHTVTRPVAEHWNGTRWAVIPLPKRVAATLSAVSCWSVTFCVAVGSSASGTPFALRWNGASWSVVPIPAPKGAATYLLTGVSCPDRAGCTAVGTAWSGSGIASTLIEHWNGRAWSIVASPNVPGAAVTILSRVSCHTSTSCTAAGQYAQSADYAGFPYDGAHPLLEQWNGGSWSVVPASEPTDSHGSVLSGVSCPTLAGCVAVGSRLGGGGLFTLTESRG